MKASTTKTTSGMKATAAVKTASGMKASATMETATHATMETATMEAAAPASTEAAPATARLGYVCERQPHDCAREDNSECQRNMSAARSSQHIFLHLN